MILHLDYVTERERKRDLKATYPVTLRGLKFPQGRLILTDATRHMTRQEEGMHAAISCAKCTSSVKLMDRTPHLYRLKNTFLRV